MKGDKTAAIELYKWNLGVSSASLELVLHAEVILRNAIDITICGKFGNNWMLDGEVLTDQTQEVVDQTAERLTAERTPVTHDRLVSAVSFGFWSALFSSPYEPLWIGTLHKAFPAGPGTRKKVGGRIASINRWRNRLAHHEPVFSHPIEKKRLQVLELCAWIDPAAADWLRAENRIDDVLARRP